MQFIQRPQRWARLGLILSVAMAITTPTASAICVAETPLTVRWAWPHDSAKDVPVDTAMWIIGSLGVEMEVTLDAEPLSRVDDQAHRYALPQLAPETTYLVRVVLTADMETADVNWSFTTGQGPRADMPPPVDLGQGLTVTSNEDHLDEPCAAVWSALDCYDTGQDVHIRFGAESEATLWEVDVVEANGSATSSAWPGSCGWPEVYTHSDALQTPGLCFIVRAFDPTGRATEAAPICPNGAPSNPEPARPPAPDPSPGEDNGCQGTPAANVWSLLTLLVLGRVRRAFAFE